MAPQRRLHKTNTFGNAIICPWIFRISDTLHLYRKT